MNDERKHLVYEVLRRYRRKETKKGIARAMGLDPKTVRKMLKEATKWRETGDQVLDRVVSQRTPRGSKLDPYEGQMKSWLEEYPKLTATRVLEMLQDMGADVGYTIVRTRVNELNEAVQKKEAVAKVDTPPGHQFQFDWSPYSIENDLIAQLFGCILSWARGHYFEASDNTRRSTCLRMLQGAFDEWRGVPYQGVTDSMPGVVDRWELGRPILNLAFVDFAAYYNFEVLISPRAMPRFKGKVERPFWYAELNLLNGRKFQSLKAFQETLAWWMKERALKLNHPDTGRPRWQMVEEERPFLQPLPARPYDTRDIAVRLVDVYGFAVYMTNRYRLPDKYIGEKVYSVIGPDRIEFVSSTVGKIKEFERIPDGAGRETGGGTKKQRYDIGLLTDRLVSWGAEAADFAAGIRDRQRYPGSHMSHLLHLQADWSLDDIVAAIRHAIDYQAYDAKSIERILAATATPHKLETRIANVTRTQVRKIMKDHPVKQRKLDQYQTLKQGDKPQHRQGDSDEEEET
jgi:transposase